MTSIKQVSLGELLTLERRPVKVDADELYAEIGIYCFGRGIFHKLPRTGLEVGDKSLFLIKDGDFILQVTFAWEGAVALASSNEDGMYGSTRYPTFRVNESLCLPLYLVNYFKTREGREQLVKISPGSAGRNRVLSLKRIPEVFVPLPPISEQRRIVARVADLSVSVQEAQRLQRQSNEQANALSTALVTGIMCKEVPRGVLGDVLIGKPRNGWSARCDNVEGGVPVLSLSAVTGFNYREHQYKKTSEATAPNAHYWLTEGDLLITRSNTPDLVGHAAIYNGSPSPCIYPDLMMRLEVDGSRADKRFVLYWLRGSLARDYVRRNAKGTSPTMKKISQSTVMNLPFPVQIPVEEQRRLVVHLDSVQSRLSAFRKLQDEVAVELNNFMPSILDKAFKGEL